MSDQTENGESTTVYPFLSDVLAVAESLGGRAALEPQMQASDLRDAVGRAETYLTNLNGLASRLALHLGQLCEHGYDHRYEGADRPCGGCYEVMAEWKAVTEAASADSSPEEGA